ncbi:muscle, skeletal receptor tyrosine protein kinase-like, partial [Stylophora pistillata]|uniref:muscle, skeletal receptor tyrosine protein kinase-like n=1 Tax=Stylophora pistillata TaxID=50429 RepID=UPI000C04540C
FSDDQTPQIVQDPKSQSASIGSNATFSCTARGFPRPTIHWIKDNASNPLQSNPRASVIQDRPRNRSQLFISRVEMGDYGKYQCIANNSIGRSQSGVAILSKDVQKLEVVDGPKNQSVSIGFNATFSCTVKGVPRPTIHWIKDNASYPLESNPRASVIQDSNEIRSLLLLTGVQKEDFGKYQCIANNSFGRSQSGVAFLNKDVQKPEIVQGPKNQSAWIGSNATFSCTAKGFPRPTIQWIKDNVSYPLQSNPRASVTLDGPTNRGQLFITRVEMEDYGNYQCLAKNSVGGSHSGKAVLSKATTTPTPVTERQLEDSASHTTIIAVSCVLIAALICVVIGFLWNRCRNRDNIHAQYTQTVAIRLRSLTNRQTESRILREHTGF